MEGRHFLKSAPGGENCRYATAIELDFESPLPTNIQRFKTIIMKLHEMYVEEFNPVYRKILSDFVGEYDCFEFSMKTLLSKCIELSRTPPPHLSLLLVCTFIYGIIADRVCQTNKCFMFVKIASQCLLAMHDRHYKDLLKNEADWKSFESYCKHLNTILARRLRPKDCKKLEPFNQDQLVELMNNLDDMGDDDLELLPSEKEMVQETFLLLPPEKGNSDESTSMCESDESSSKEESCMAESDERLGMVEDGSDDTNMDCIYCKTKCFEIVSYSLTEEF